MRFGTTALLVLLGTKKSLVHFTTPDNAYVAEPETDGISTIVKMGSALEN